MKRQFPYSILKVKPTAKYAMLTFLFVFCSIQVSSFIADAFKMDLFQIVSIEMTTENDTNESQEEVEENDLFPYLNDMKIDGDLSAVNTIKPKILYYNNFSYLDTPPPEV